MRSNRLVVPAILSIAAALVATYTSSSSAFEAASDVSSDRRTEINRIHAHFDSVLRELSAQDIATLSNSQVEHRRRLMFTLRDYNARGVFPHNYDFADSPTPYFIDRKTGTLCAVAYLLQSTGRRDIVNRVAEMNNNVWVAELKSDTSFNTWLDKNGITLDEAARIQVPYMGDQQPLTSAQKTRNTAFAIVAPIAVGSATITSVWNALGNSDGHHRVVNWLGVSTGVVATGLGAVLASKSDLPGAARGVGGAGAAIGAMSIALSARGMHRQAVFANAQRKSVREAEGRRAGAEASISPILPIGNNASSGMAVSIRF